MLTSFQVIGTVAFIVLQAKRVGPQAHNRYFQLKGMSGPQKERHIEERQAAYTSFGIPAVLLETVRIEPISKSCFTANHNFVQIPVAGIFFAFTNTCGAALWAADLESTGTTAPGLKEQAE